jgi:hypothetical protein
MITLGPDTLTLQNKSGDTETFEVRIFLHDPKEEGTPEHEDGLAYYGEILLSFSSHERRMKISCINSIELVGVLKKFAEAYISRTCEVNDLTLFRNIPGDIKVPTDMFR